MWIYPVDTQIVHSIVPEDKILLLKDIPFFIPKKEEAR